MSKLLDLFKILKDTNQSIEISRLLNKCAQSEDESMQDLIDNPNILEQALLNHDVVPIRDEKTKSSMIGIGSYGTVLRGVFKGNTVAVKIVGPDSREPAIWERILKIDFLPDELKHIPTIYGVFNGWVQRPGGTLSLGVKPESVPMRMLDRDTWHYKIIIMEELSPVSNRLEEILAGEHNYIDEIVKNDTYINNLIQAILTKTSVFKDVINHADMRDISNKIFQAIKEVHVPKELGLDIDTHRGLIARVIFDVVKVELESRGIHTEYNDGFEISRIVFNYLAGGGLFPQEWYDFEEVEPYWGRLPETKGLVSALKKLQQAGIIYTDIKPDNLMMDPQTGDLVIIDVGLYEDNLESFASNEGQKIFYHGSPTPDIKILEPRDDPRLGVTGLFVSDKPYGPMIFSLLPTRAESEVNIKTVGEDLIEAEVNSPYPLNEKGWVYIVSPDPRTIVERKTGRFFLTEPAEVIDKFEVNKQDIINLGVKITEPKDIPDEQDESNNQDSFIARNLDYGDRQEMLVYRLKKLHNNLDKHKLYKSTKLILGLIKKAQERDWNIEQEERMLDPERIEQEEQVWRQRQEGQEADKGRRMQSENLGWKQVSEIPLNDPRISRHFAWLEMGEALKHNLLRNFYNISHPFYSGWMSQTPEYRKINDAVRGFEPDENLTEADLGELVSDAAASALTLFIRFNLGALDRLVRNYGNKIPRYIGTGNWGDVWELGTGQALKITEASPVAVYKMELATIYDKAPGADTENMIHAYGRFKGYVSVNWIIMEKFKDLNDLEKEYKVHRDVIYDIVMTSNNFVNSLMMHGRIGHKRIPWADEYKRRITRDAKQINEKGLATYFLENTDDNFRENMSSSAKAIEEILRNTVPAQIKKVEDKINPSPDWLESLAEQQMIKHMTGRRDLHVGNIGLRELDNQKYFIYFDA